MTVFANATTCSSRGDSPGPSCPSPTPRSPNEPTRGSVGQARLFQNFRIMFLNGCYYEESESQAAAQKISQLFRERIGADIKVHYTHIPTTFSQAREVLRRNVEHPGSTFLLQTIQKRLKNIDHPRSHKPSAFSELEGGGRLALVVHSGGGVLLKSIMGQLTLKERQKIDVITMGSAWLFKKEDFHSVQNFIAYWDPVPRLAQLATSLWPRRYNAEVLPAGSPLQKPVISHKFFRGPYQGALKQVIDAYVDKGLLSTQPTPLSVM